MNLFLGTLYGNLFLKTFLLVTSFPGKPAWNSCWQPFLGNLFLVTLPGTLLGNLLGNLAWEPVPGTLLGNLFLRPVPNLKPCGFGCSEGLSWKRKPFLGTRFPTLRCADLAAPACSGTFTMAEDPKLTLLGKNIRLKHIGKVAEVSEDFGISWDLRRDFHVKIFTKMCQAAGAAHRPTARMQNPGGRRSPQSEGQ